MIEENNFAPHTVFSVDYFKNKKLLILIPHPDDESFGCGGTLFLISKIATIDFCIITDGSKSDDNVSSQDRYKELENVTAYLNIRKSFFLNIIDRTALININKIENEIRKILIKDKYDIIFSPSIFEFHPDHKATAKVAINLFYKKFIKNILFYEITFPQPIANLAINITDIIKNKQELMSFYPSQLSLNNYKEYTLSINKSRCLTLPNNVEYAEVFYIVEKPRDLSKYSLLHLLKTENLDTFATLSFVTVIIRTYNRKNFLKDALSSLVLQSYKNFEVIVVNDGGENVEDILSFFDDKLDVSLINSEANRGRGASGNIGIERAKGDYIIFLDDDDLFYPNALESLVLNIYGNDACYGKTLCTKIENNEEHELFSLGKDFFYEELFFRNYIPLISILFKKDSLIKAGGFDESFEIYEDWDLIFRIAENCKIKFIDEYISIYRTFGESTLTVKGGDKYHYNWMKKFYNKHSDKFTPELTEAFLREYYGRLSKIEDLERELEKLKTENMRKEHLLNEIYSSKAWRFITFYRNVIKYFK